MTAMWLVPALWLGLMSSVGAAVALSDTRLVFDGRFHEVAVDVANQGNQEALIQAWLSLPGSDIVPAGLPFVVSPPLASLPPGGRQTLRILYEGVGMPADREALLHFYVLDIPRRSESDHSLNIAVRQRINLFWRPRGLPADPAHAASALVWSRKAGSSSTRVRNPTPYHVVLLRLSLGSQLVEEHILLEPFKEHIFERWPAAPENELRFQVLTDYGGTLHYCLPPGLHKAVKDCEA